MARAKQPKIEDPNKLKRERAGRYVTADARFAVEGESPGSWYVIDNERQNELGLALMEGPFGTLDDARERVLAARSMPTATPEPDAGPAPDGEPASRPKLRVVPDPTRSKGSKADVAAAPEADQPAETAPMAEAAAPESSGPAPAPGRKAAATPPAATQAATAEAPATTATPANTPTAPAAPAAPAKRPAHRAPPATSPDALPAPTPPAWLARLSDAEQADAARLLAILDRMGIDDPALARREVEANTPELARALLVRRLAAEALDIWRTPESARQEVEAVTGATRRSQRALVEPAAQAAERVFDGHADPADVAALAWLVALRTVDRVAAVLDAEGDARRVVGEPGWRLLELDGRREPTRRGIAIDAADLLEPPGS